VLSQDVCPSVCLSHAAIVSKRLNHIKLFNRRIATPLSLPCVIRYYSDGTPPYGASNAGGVRKSRFSTNISLSISEMIQDTAIVTIEFELESYHLQQRWTIPNLNSKVTPLFDAEYPRNCMRYNQKWFGIRIKIFGLSRSGYPLDRSQNVVNAFPCRRQSFRWVSWKSTADCMRNANKSTKMPYSATMRKVEK